MYALIDFLCFASGIAAIALLVAYQLAVYTPLAVLWLVAYPFLTESIYNLWASCGQRTVYSGSWHSRIVYHDGYNLSFFGIEKCHPFDAQKYRNVYAKLLERGVINRVVTPERIPRQLLLECLSKWLLLKLCYSIPICKYIEMPLVMFPSCLLRWRVLNPMLLATEGTVLSAVIAMQKGWAINLSGGYHHANQHSGSGFCIYSDIYICVHYLRTRLNLRQILIVDLDAHQGNGYERDLLEDRDVFILDVYNRDIFPGDWEAARAIRKSVYVSPQTTDEEYLEAIQCLGGIIAEFRPQFIIYNAGTDIMAGDPLSHLNISPDAIIQRDQYVIQTAVRNRIPINYLLSGGYQKENAGVIAASIENLYKKFD